MNRVTIRPQVRIELLETADWYEARSDGLGAEFLSAFDITLEKIVRRPLIHQIAFGSMRKARLRGFPYFIVYQANDDEIVIFSCLHGSRDPATWQQSL